MGAAALCAAALLTACATLSPRAPAPLSWAQRLTTLQQDRDWGLQGRAAVAAGSHGWQAGVDWQQRGPQTVVHLSGPLGIGASVLRLTSAGLSVNGAPANPDVVDQLQQRLGFDLPLANLRFWLLGVPDPGLPSEIVQNDHDRARRLTQAGWVIDFDRYTAVDGDWLPAMLVLNNRGVRVRIVVDHWDGVR